MTAIARARASLTPSFLRGERNRRIAGRVLAAVVIVFVAILPLFFTLTATFVSNATIALAYIVMALGLNIVVGFAGLLDLGYVAFYALGAYAMGWFGSIYFVKGTSTKGIDILAGPEASGEPGIHMNFLLIILAAIVICSIAGILIGLPTLRLRGDYIAIVTLAFGEIIRVVATNGEDIKLFGYELTNGKKGITPIDVPALPGYGTLPVQDFNLRPWYWLALVMVLIVLFCNVRLRDSRLGRAWIAVREDEVAATSMGIPAVKIKLLAYASGAAFGGMAGAFLGAYQRTVNADQFEFSFSILILAMVILGGLGSIWGVVLGAAALSFLERQFINETAPNLLKDIGVTVDSSQLKGGVFGFLLVVMMVLRPEGLLPERRRKLEMTEGVGTGGGESVYEARAT
jgi:branched-chain amino acid transport system permease protein